MRLHDNQALSAALEQGEPVLPLFILDSHILTAAHFSSRRYAFLLAGLRQLDADLRARGSYLALRAGDPATELHAVAAALSVRAIYAEEDYTPYARRRDQAVAASLPLRLTAGLTVRHPTQVHKADGSPYTVFTPFSRAWLAQPLPQWADLRPAPPHLVTPPLPTSLPVPQTPVWPADTPFPAGEAEAQRRLRHFMKAGILHYHTRRNQLDVAGTSTLSPYLRLGMLSARAAVAAAAAARVQALDSAATQGAHTWLLELIWREFYHHILYHFPQVQHHSFKPEYDRLAWGNDADAFAAWCEGRTGYPVVDAAMRQLYATGWLHNRTRMIVASFLTKDLLLDWRWGERWFWQQLVDGDLAANNGGWQWTAGVGVDAAPYFRIFNPVTQSEKFDPAGRFIQRWLPELAHVPTAYIHAPWTMPADVQATSGCHIGRDYPAPIVDHAAARQRTLAAFQALRL